MAEDLIQSNGRALVPALVAGGQACLFATEEAVLGALFLAAG